MISSVPPSLDLAAILVGDDEIGEPFPDDELIPARMLNEFTYCPRLAYLEWVQGEFSDNLETRQGTFGHRNVDKPTTKPVPRAKEKDESDRVTDGFDEVDDEDGMATKVNASVAGSLRYESGGTRPPGRRENDTPFLNPSCDAHEPFRPTLAASATSPPGSAASENADAFGSAGGVGGEAGCSGIRWGAGCSC